VASGWVRRLVSVIAVAGLAAAGWGYARLPGSAETAGPAPRGEAARPEPFHAYDRGRLAEPGGYCTSCHPAAAHLRDPVLRAFRNLHRVGLGCGVCHLAGPRLTVRRFSDRGNRLFAARRTPEGWQAVDRPGAEARFRPRGLACRQCHRRGSPWLNGPGLFDAYRRRLLEDLAVLRRLEGVR